MPTHRTKDRIQRSADSGWRRITARSRTTPDFLIIGAQRAGTTSLAQDLGWHPQIARPRLKEVHYFDRHHMRGLTWYGAHFALESQMAAVRTVQGRAITGEATPNYMFHPRAARWVNDELPGTKVIAILRDPVTRAHSH